jgi:hypothetical protein
LSIGEPLGVSVDDVITGSAAEGVLVTGDVITEMDGTPTRSASDLIASLADKQPGDSIVLTIVHDDATETAPLTLGESPDDPSRPQIGIMIRTAYDTVPFRDAAQEVSPSTTTRPIALGGHVLLFEPETGAWLHTDTEVEGATWVATTQGIYTLSDDETAVMTEVTSGEEVDHDGFQEWKPRRLLGSLGPQLILLVVSDIPDQPGFVNVAVALFDPKEGATRWVTPVLQDFGLPVVAIGSPDQSAFVLVGADQETGTVTGVEFYDSQGTIRATGDLVGLGTPVGWFDGTSMAFRSSEELISVYSFVDGSTQNYTLPGTLIDALIAAVGDGRQVLAVDGRDLLINDLTTEGEVKTIAQNCSVGRIGEPGWGL